MAVAGTVIAVIATVVAVDAVGIVTGIVAAADREREPRESETVCTAGELHSNCPARGIDFEVSRRRASNCSGAVGGQLRLSRISRRRPPRSNQNPLLRSNRLHLASPRQAGRAFNQRQLFRRERPSVLDPTSRNGSGRDDAEEEQPNRRKQRRKPTQEPTRSNPLPLCKWSNSQPAAVVEAVAEAHTEPVQAEAAQSEPAAAEIETSGEALREHVHPEAVPVENEASAPEESEAEPENRGAVRRSWRERVSKIFSAAAQEADHP